MTEKIERLAEALVLTEPTDVRGVSEVCAQFRELICMKEVSAQPEATWLAEAAAQILQKVIRNEAADAPASLALACQVMTAIQGLLIEGRHIEEIKLPGDLTGAWERAPVKGQGPEAAPDQAHPVPVSSTAREGEGSARGPSISGDAELMLGFAAEGLEHLEGAEVDLLALETDPSNKDALHAVFRSFHTIKGTAGLLSLDEIRSLAHEAENLLDRVRKGNIVLAGAALDLIFEVVDSMKRMLGGLQRNVSAGNPPGPEASVPGLLSRLREEASGHHRGIESGAQDPGAESAKKLGEILVESGAVTPRQIEAALSAQNESGGAVKLGEQLIRQGRVTALDVAQALRAQRRSSTPSAMMMSETLRVDARRLERLVETIGELVIAELMVSQTIVREIDDSPVLSQQMGQLDKITRELQEMGTSLRMVPLRSTFQRMARLVRDLARQAGKPLRFVMSGEDTELDKAVVEAIVDPLVHILRNAVAHGIEAHPEERKKAGKPETGRVELRASHRGGSIFIEIEDDGRGLDREGILAGARRLGLAGDTGGMSDRDVWNLIFIPGVTTVLRATEVSGRGVGMDVVKRNIEALRGQVEIRTEPGKGTTFILRLPLTLAIIDGMVVRVGPERYIIPTLSIVRLVRPDSRQLISVFHKGEVLCLDTGLLPLVRLSSLYNINGAQTDATGCVVVVVEDDGRHMGLLTDEVLGQQQVVIKALGETMRGIPGVSGGAVMPDGQVGLILDIGNVVQLATARGLYKGDIRTMDLGMSAWEPSGTGEHRTEALD